MTEAAAVTTVDEPDVDADADLDSGQVATARDGEVVDAARQNDAVSVTAQRDVSGLSDDELAPHGVPYDEYIASITCNDVFLYTDEKGPVYRDAVLDEEYRIEFWDGVRVHVRLDGNICGIHHTRAQYRARQRATLEASGYTWEELDAKSGNGCFGFDSMTEYHLWRDVKSLFGK